MRYLAIDLGGKRTGIAIGDDATRIVTPARVIEHPPGELLRNEIVKEIDRHGPDEVIIGLPLNMDGTEGPQAKSAREFSETIAARIEQPIRFQDERLTSYEADQRLARSGKTHREKKDMRDALAAAAILNDYLDALDRARSEE